MSKRGALSNPCGVESEGRSIAVWGSKLRGRAVPCAPRGVVKRGLRMPGSMESDVPTEKKQNVREDGLANPYRSPSTLEGETLASDVDPVPRDDAVRVSYGLALSRVGSLLLAFAVVATASWAALFHNGSLYEAAGSWRSRSVLAAPVPFVLMVVLGAHLCNRVRGKHRSLCWLATLLLVVGGLGSMASAARLVGGGQLLGLSILFAASTFSAFLTGVALFALFFSRLVSALRIEPRRSFFLRARYSVWRLQGSLSHLACSGPTFPLRPPNGWRPSVFTSLCRRPVCSLQASCASNPIGCDSPAANRLSRSCEVTTSLAQSP